MPRYAMVIDLQRCVGCGGCSIACRNENNVTEGIYWSNKITETVGTFPNVRYHYIPTLCNHCAQRTLRARLPDAGHAQARQRHHHARPRQVHRLQVLRVQLPLRGHLLQLGKAPQVLAQRGGGDPRRDRLAERRRSKRSAGRSLPTTTRNGAGSPRTSGPRGSWRNAPSATTGSPRSSCRIAWRPARPTRGSSAISRTRRAR
ncbi:MAG: hypothetical protein MZV70_33280 [Desulfobacterales bacterium]|nr:hypothetical protein [Desulfobacterales bacterium]